MSFSTFYQNMSFEELEIYKDYRIECDVFRYENVISIFDVCTSFYNKSLLSTFNTKSSFCIY